MSDQERIKTIPCLHQDFKAKNDGETVVYLPLIHRRYSQDMLI